MRSTFPVKYNARSLALAEAVIMPGELEKAINPKKKIE
jgi:hypothetical protein